jgi:hypothetical protein
VASSEQALEGAAFSVCFEEMTLPLAGTLEGADTSGGKSPLLKCGSCRKSVHARVFHAVEVQPREAHDDGKKILLEPISNINENDSWWTCKSRTEGNMLDNIV